jgi:adenosylhomocysteine nucleosidase
MLGIVTGMIFEADIVRDAALHLPSAERPVVSCHGFGRSAARRAAAQAVADGATGLLSFGIAGGLDSRLSAGDVILATEVVNGEDRHATDGAWTTRLRNLLFQHHFVTPASIAHAAHVLSSPGEKRALRESAGAAAVDMESCGTAEIAAERGLPFAALRVIADTAGDALPSVALAATTPDGRVAVMKSVMGALAHPQQIPALIWLGRRTDAARHVMKRLADAGLPDFGLNQP